ncbi:hypothetical protein EOD39_17341 [Acipenser ruthenus]|uniref:Uncharacterized protein n=1 Tax=Acipenser ruthenus TaxID=7906 RepID=A0A444V3M6_ACIRT|nr:hypothetical protein EOD39_17341 [Acipenser ruthenus]
MLDCGINRILIECAIQTAAKVNPSFPRTKAVLAAAAYPIFVRKSPDLLYQATGEAFLAGRVFRLSKNMTKRKCAHAAAAQA